MRTVNKIASAAVAVGLFAFAPSAQAQFGGGVKPQAQQAAPTSTFQFFTAPSTAPLAVKQAVGQANTAIGKIQSARVRIAGVERTGLLSEAQVRLIRGSELPSKITVAYENGTLNTSKLNELVSEVVASAAEINLTSESNAQLAGVIETALSEASVEANSTELAALDIASGLDSAASHSRSTAALSDVSCGLLEMTQGAVAPNSGAANNEAFTAQDLRAANTASLEQLYAAARELNEARTAAGLAPVEVQVTGWASADGQRTPFSVTGSEASLKAFFSGSASKFETGELSAVSLMIVESGKEVLAAGTSFSSESELWFAIMNDLKNDLAAVVGEERALQIVGGQDGVIDANGGVAGECPVNFGFSKAA